MIKYNITNKTPKELLSLFNAVGEGYIDHTRTIDKYGEPEITYWWVVMEDSE